MLKRLIERYGINSEYCKLWIASAISNLGDGVLEAAAPLLAASLTRDPALVAGMNTAASLPWLIFPLISGALADRWDRRITMVGANIFRACVIAVVGFTVLGNWTTIWFLYVAAFLLGSVQTLFDTTAQSVLPAVVNREELETANGRLYAAEIITNNFAGKPLGGFLFAIAPVIPFFFNTVSRLGTAFQIFRLKGSFQPKRTSAQAGKSIWIDIREGIRWLLGHRLLRTLALMVGMMNLCSSMVFATFVLFAQDILKLGDVGFGLLLTAGAVGGLAGSLVGDHVVKRFGPGTSIMLSIATGALCYAAVALTKSAFVVGAAFVVSSAASLIWNVVTVSFRQSIIPDGLLGRVNSVYRFLAWGSMPIGAMAGGFVARAFGLRAPYWIAASLQAVMFFFAPSSINNQAILNARQEAGMEVS